MSTAPATIPMHQRPQPPADLPDDVRAEFERLVSLMGDRARAEDSYLLAMLATSWQTWRRAAAEIDERGNVVMSGGTAIANPSLSVAHQAYGQILALSKELGITPAARKKASRFEDHDDDE